MHFICIIWNFIVVFKTVSYLDFLPDQLVKFWENGDIERKLADWETDSLSSMLLDETEKKPKHRVTESVARKDPYLLKSHKSRAKGLIFVILCRYWWRSHMVNIFSSGTLNNFSCDSTFRYLVWNTTIRIVVMISFKGFVTVRSMYYTEL